MLLPRFRPVADYAILVELGAEVTEEAHAAVLRLDRALAASPFHGFVEAVPAFVNLLVEFDPLLTDHIIVETALRDLFDTSASIIDKGQLREVVVCYEDPFSANLADVAAQTGLSPEAVINAHLAGEYEVYMYGFAPGYAYLTGVPEPIQLPRKPSAVHGVEAGSVVIAGSQCIVTTLTMPTGWWIIGRSPTRVLTGDAGRPFLFNVGDRIAFRRISRATFSTFEAI